MQFWAILYMLFQPENCLATTLDFIVTKSKCEKLTVKRAIAELVVQSNDSELWYFIILISNTLLEET